MEKSLLDLHDTNHDLFYPHANSNFHRARGVVLPCILDRLWLYGRLHCHFLDIPF